MTELNDRLAALRSHDVHQGLYAGEVDRNSGLPAREMETTQLVGMAAALASAIKGQDVVANAQDLKSVAADQLDIGPFAFNQVVEVLEETEFIRNVVRKSGGQVASFYESVPEEFSRLYETLGEVWESRSPTEIERSLLSCVEDLSHGPRPVEDLDVDRTALPSMLSLGEASEAIRIVTVRDQKVVYSPFFAYENPEEIEKTLAGLEIAEVRSAFSEVRGYQGTPLSKSGSAEVINGLIAAGLMAGPALERPDHSMESFAIAPYGLPPDLLTIRKPVLDKALAVLTAVRMGEHFGGITRLRSPEALLHALLDPDRVVARHSSTRRQYAVLHRMGIIRFVNIQGRDGIQAISAKDNLEAIQLALDLISYGEAAETKEALAADQILVQGSYRSPIQSVRPARKRASLPPKLIDDLFESAMGRRPL